MTNKKHFIFKISAVLLSLLALITVIFLPQGIKARAEEDIEPYGIYTNLKLDLGANSSEIYAVAKNKFTLGNSTVSVYVYLYSSDTYQEDYNAMNLESYNYIADLDQGHSIKTSAPTNGEQKYWRAVMRYKRDNDDWAEKQTPTVLFSGKGEQL